MVGSRTESGRRSVLSLVAVVAGVFALQMLFVWSYVGALHDPEPKYVPVTVIGPQAGVQQVRDRLERGSDDFEFVNKDGEGAARKAVENREVYGAFVMGYSSDRLLVASAAGPSVSDFLEQAFGKLERAQGRPLDVHDVTPLEDGDAKGLSSFYATVGWIVGGYLLATVVGIFRGTRSSSRMLALVRVVGFAAFSIAAGIGGTLVVDPGLDALTGNGLALAAAGALITFSSATITSGLTSLAGVFGIGIAILLMVVLGNPASGGPLAPELMPNPWRAIGPYLPTGAGTYLVRSVIYFTGHATRQPLLVLAAYCAAGTGLTLLLAHGSKTKAKTQVEPSNTQTDASFEQAR